MAVTPRLKTLFTEVRRLRRELARRLAEEEDRWYAVLTVADLEILASSEESERRAFLLAMLESEEYATPFDLKAALYPDDLPAIQAPAPIAQPVIEPQAPELPAIEPMPAIQAPVMAGLVRAKFTGRLAPGSTSVPTVEGLKPLNPGEVYLFEVVVFSRIRAMWPGWWEQV